MIKDSNGNARFYGVYRGSVVSVRDPLNRQRITARVPQVLFDQVTGWAWPINPGQATPQVGDGVFVMFEGGDPSFPLWLGSFKPTLPTPA